MRSSSWYVMRGRGIALPDAFAIVRSSSVPLRGALVKRLRYSSSSACLRASRGALP